MICTLQMSQQQHNCSPAFSPIVILGFDCIPRMTGCSEGKSKTKRFLTTPSGLKQKKEQKKKRKQKQGPSVSIYIYSVLTTMNKTPASQALLGQLK